MPDQDWLSKLQAVERENAGLIALLESRGIEWRPPPALEPSRLSTGEKVELRTRVLRIRTPHSAVRVLA